MFPEKSVVDEIRKARPKKILLQLPEGLKTNALEMVDTIEKNTGASVLISCDPCFGACDIRDSEAERLGCDLVLHVGHSDFGLRTKVPVIYEEYRIEYDAVGLLKNNLEKLKPYKNISLVTTLQFVHLLDGAKKLLEKNDKKVLIGKPQRAKHSGQVLGCDFSAAESVDEMADVHIFFGSCFFHPLGLASKTKKPVLFLDFEKNQLTELAKEREKQERIKAMRIAEARDFIHFGILVSVKPGQLNIKLAENLKKKLEQKGKKAWILVMDEITPDKIIGMHIDCLINTACPRLYEDTERLEKPLLNAEDADNL